MRLSVPLTMRIWGCTVGGWGPSELKLDLCPSLEGRLAKEIVSVTHFIATNCVKDRIVLQKHSNGALHDGSNGDCRGQMQQQAMKTAAAAQMIKESVQSHKPGPFHLERSQIQHEFGHLLQLEGAATPG